MNTLRKTFVATVVALGLAPLALAPASAHGSFHGGGGFGHGPVSFGHGFGGDDRHDFHRHYGWNSGFYAYPAFDVEYGATSSCQEGFHLGEDGRCWADKR